MEGDRYRSGLLKHFLLTLILPDLIYSLSHPGFMSKRFGKYGSSHLPALVQIPIPETQKFADFEVPDYDDNYVPLANTGENEKYSFVPVYGYFGESSVVDPVEEDESEKPNYSYGRETWFEGGDNDDNVAFLRNLILSRMDPGDGDPEENEIEAVPYVYGRPVEYSPDYDEDEVDRTWSYGIPVLEERESAGDENDESVKELESLRNHIKAEDAKVSKFKYEKRVPLPEDDEFLNQQVQKQISRSSRKNNVPVRGGFNKRFYSPEKSVSKTVMKQNHQENGKESDGKSKTETTALPHVKFPENGQKEYVLPRPANPIRKPTERGIYPRSWEKASVYDTIKKLLAMEEGLEKANPPRIQKRFVLSEDQLTSQLSGLKKTA